jgi:hypothetical protein
MYVDKALQIFPPSAQREAHLRKIGLYYKRYAINEVYTSYYFPVVAVGHGVLILHTAIVHNKKDNVATAVQVEAKMCEHAQYSAFPLCANYEAVLTKIALRLSKRSVKLTP